MSAVPIGQAGGAFLKPCFPLYAYGGNARPPREIYAEVDVVALTSRNEGTPDGA